MIIKEAHTYGIDDAVSYSLIDNVEKVDVGQDFNSDKQFIKYYLKNRKDPAEYETLWVEDTVVYIMNDASKTVSVVRPTKK